MVVKATTWLFTFQLLRMDSDDSVSVSDIGTLSSLIQVKLANHDTCVEWEPEKSLLKSAKGATKQYNQ